MDTISQQFQEYLTQPIAEQAAKSLADGVQIEFCIMTPKNPSLLNEPEQIVEVFTFTKKGRKNQILFQAAEHPELVFTLTPNAATEILKNPSKDIGEIGVSIAKLIISKDENTKISIKLRSGMLGLFTKGYLGVITSGGVSFASFLATRGLSGMSAIKDAIGRMKQS